MNKMKLLTIACTLAVSAALAEEKEDKPCLCNLTGKNICGFVFGDVYPDKCRWFSLSQPFYLFEKMELSYNEDGVLREVMFSKDLSARYTKESVIKEMRAMKVALEKHFGFTLEEVVREDHSEQSEDEQIFYCKTSPRMSFSDDLCSAWIRVRYETCGKRVRKFGGPFYSIFVNIEDKSKVGDLAKRPVHRAVARKQESAAKPEIGVEELLSSPFEDAKIVRELKQSDLDACVASQTKYTWGDIEEGKVTGVCGCKAAVELQKHGSHMRNLSLRDKELAQEAAVELSDRIDVLEREFRALKEKVK